MTYLTDEEFDKMYNEIANDMSHGMFDFSPSDVVERIKKRGYTRKFKIRVGTGKPYDFFGDLHWSWIIIFLTAVVLTVVVCSCTKEDYYDDEPITYTETKTYESENGMKIVITTTTTRNSRRSSYGTKSSGRSSGSSSSLSSGSGLTNYNSPISHAMRNAYRSTGLY